MLVVGQVLQQLELDSAHVATWVVGNARLQAEQPGGDYEVLMETLWMAGWYYEASREVREQECRSTSFQYLPPTCLNL